MERIAIVETVFKFKKKKWRTIKCMFSAKVDVIWKKKKKHFLYDCVNIWTKWIIVAIILMNSTHYVLSPQPDERRPCSHICLWNKTYKMIRPIRECLFNSHYIVKFAHIYNMFLSYGAQELDRFGLRTLFFWLLKRIIYYFRNHEITTLYIIISL